MRDTDHLDSDSLILFLDGELGEPERVQAYDHLLRCSVCRSKRDQFARLSARVESLVASLPLSENFSARQSVSAILESRQPLAEPNASKIMKRFAWGMALAATLAISVVLAPKERNAGKASATAVSSTPSSSIEIDGETFVSLPYSNPDLPVTASHIVEMQVPVSSLAAVGVWLPPYPDGTGDRTVAANVLLGLDGQPLAVHVLSAD